MATVAVPEVHVPVVVKPPPPPAKMGNSKHVRAPRIVTPPSRNLPAALANLSKSQVNDPKSYRCLPPDWTGIILVSEYVHCFLGSSICSLFNLFFYFLTLSITSQSLLEPQIHEENRCLIAYTYLIEGAKEDLI
jgi:hypothetical protein